MNTQVTTKFKILRPTNEVFEALVDPEKIGNFWFSSSSERWEQGKRVKLKYDEYNAEGVINLLEIQENKKIVFTWGEEEDAETTVTITFNELDNGHSTVIEVTESGFNDNDPEVVNKMIGNKGGWVYMLSCLKCYLENDVISLRASLIH